MKVNNIPSTTRMSGFYIVYKTPCLVDKPQERGIFHLIEHMICRQIQPYYGLFEQFAIDFNAITTHDYVVFYIAGIDDYINKYKDDFYELVTKHYQFDEKELFEEKTVILQEYANFFSNPSSAIKANGLRKYYNYYGPIGQRNSIENIDLESLQSIYKQRFSCPFMIINVSQKPEFQKEIRPCVVSPKDKIEYLTFLEYNDAEFEPVSSNSILISAMKDFIPNEDLSKSQMLNYLLCGSINAPIVNRLRTELCLCYSVFLTDCVIGNRHTVFIETETEEKNKKVVVNNISHIIDNLDLFITRDLYNLAVDHFRVKREMQMIARHNNITDLFYPNLMQVDALESLTYESVLEHGKIYYSDYIQKFIAYE